MSDTYRVNLYLQLGVNPDPETDTLLGEDLTFPSDQFDIIIASLPEGRHTIYSVAWDLAGNQSNIDDKDIGSLPNPMKVSGLVDWTLGELHQTQIGIFSS